MASDCLEVADKVRINAGNFSDKLSNNVVHNETEFLQGRQKLQEKLKNFFNKAKTLLKPVRIGINRGSLAQRIINKFSDPTVAMWESAKECIEAANYVSFDQIVLSFKSSDVQDMIACNRLACQEMQKLGYKFPIHLGVTESGEGQYGRIKSSIGIGTLLEEGIGDTIRISLTEDPINEIEVAKNILQACQKRQFFAEIISCPSCGRTSYDIQSAVKFLTPKLRNIKAKIAVMGCAINGLGEAKNADFAIIGNPNGTLSLYKKNERLGTNMSVEDTCNQLLNFLKK